MTDGLAKGSDWEDWQNDLLVADYFAMLAMESGGVSFNKAERNRNLQALIRRERTAIERKHMNVSAVLDELEMAYIDGYKPLARYQQSLVDAVERYLDANPALVFGPPPTLTEHVEEAVELIVVPPPALGFGGVTQPKSPKLDRIVRRYNHAERDARNRALGEAGEKRILLHERMRLIAADRPDLAQKIQWTSKELGDGAGYDIRSFDPDGAERFIEVKTTRGGPRTDFFLSRNERAFSEEEPERFRLYRLYDFGSAPSAHSGARLFALKPPLEQSVRLEAEVWRAGF